MGPRLTPDGDRARPARGPGRQVFRRTLAPIAPSDPACGLIGSVAPRHRARRTRWSTSFPTPPRVGAHLGWCGPSSPRSSWRSWCSGSRSGAGGSIRAASSRPRSRRRPASCSWRCSCRHPACGLRRWSRPRSRSAPPPPGTTRRSSSSSVTRSRSRRPPLASAVLLRWYARGPFRLTRVRELCTLVAAAAVGGVLGAALLTLAVAINREPSASVLWRSAWPLAIAIGAGMVLVPTAALTLLTRAPASYLRGRDIEAGRWSSRSRASRSRSPSSRTRSCSPARSCSCGARSASGPRRWRGPASMLVAAADWSAARLTGPFVDVAHHARRRRRPADRTPRSRCSPRSRSHWRSRSATRRGRARRRRRAVPAHLPRLAGRDGGHHPRRPHRRDQPRAVPAARRCPTTRWSAPNCGRCWPDDSGEHEVLRPGTPEALPPGGAPGQRARQRRVGGDQRVAAAPGRRHQPSCRWSCCAT